MWPVENAVSKLFFVKLYNLNKFHSNVCNILRKKYNLDYSKVPTINESDLIEQNVRGSGPGGQCMSRTNNCVVLRHIPTGVHVKCHETRSLDQNRKIARSILLEKLDLLFNGKNSILEQKKRIDLNRRNNLVRQREKKKKLKEEWEKQLS